MGNPFYDRFAFVEDAFLSNHGLIKGDTILSENRQEIDNVWTSAPKHKDHRHGKLGGSCANVIKVLAKLGHQCALCGKIGNDDVGEALLERLTKIGILPLLTHGKKGTGVVNCFVTPDCQRTMQTYLGCAVEFSKKEIEKNLFDPINHLHLEGYGAYYDDTLEMSIALAKERKATISLDLASRYVVKLFKSKFSEIIPDIDFLFSNTEEIMVLTGTTSPQEALKQFGKDQIIVSTEGARGCWVKGSGKTTAAHFDALKIPKVIDTTGAGDYFDAAFLHGIFMQKSIEECVGLGNLAAGYIIQHLGADLPDAQWSELITRIV